MKTSVPFRIVCSLLFVLQILNFTVPVFSQGIPDLQFTQVVLESGSAGQDGAQYRFPNVTSGIDAVIEIKGRSSAAVELSNIDTSASDMGYDKAFQPVLGIRGTAPANTNWSMDFQLTFYKTGTKIKTTVAQFNATGLDIDGDGMTLNEWAIMNGISSIDSAVINSLTFAKLGSSGGGDNYKVEGITANAPGIDTTAKNVMATYKFMNKNQIDFTIGARTSSSATTAGMRFNSIWFRNFLGITLPVKLVSFTAGLKGQTADLKWMTASEINTARFIIEKSEDGRIFSKAGEVAASGNTNTEVSYGYSDKLGNETGTLVYYRLRSVDIDGKSEYSDVKMIRLNLAADNSIRILAYPNPVTSELHITVPASLQNKKITYSLSDASGHAIRTIEAAFAGQTETFSMNHLSPGIYIVSIQANGLVAQQKIIKS